jgi:DNA repair exonuclease SbcCD nuclease subunit
MSGAIVTSDWHAHGWTRFASTRSDGVNTRFADLLDTIDQIEIAVMEHNPSYLIHLGDLTHRRGFVAFSTYTEIIRRLRELVQKYALRVIIIPGNHDIESEGHHALGPLKYIEGITVVDEPELTALLDEWVYFVPYMDGERVVEAFQSVKRNVELAFAHYMLDGHVLNGGEYGVPSALQLSDTDNFKRVVFGHVHAPAVEHDGRIIYAGAPLHFDFGDVGKRYCWWFPTLSAAPLAIELKAPRFVTTSYPRIPVAPLEKSGFLRVLGTPAGLYEDVKRQAREVGWLDCVAIEASVPDDAVRTLSTALMSDEVMVRAFVARQYPDASESHREHIAEFGLSCLREAQR